MSDEGRERLYEVNERAGAAILGDEVIGDLWQAIRPKHVSETRFRKAICRWAGIAEDCIKLAGDDLSIRDKCRALERFSNALREAAKAWNDLGDAQIDLWRYFETQLAPTNSDVPFSGLAEAIKIFDFRLAVHLEDVACHAENLSDQMTAQSGRPTGDAKRNAIAELVLIWRWATGQDRLGEGFDNFGQQALSTLYRWPTSEGVKNWVEDRRAVSAAISRNPSDYDLCYLP